MNDAARFRRGDHNLFEELIRVHGPMVLNTIRAFEKDSTQAEDLFQEVWMQAYRRREQYSGIGSIPAWLHRLASNVCLSDLRARKSRLRTLDRASRQGPEEQIGWRPLNPLDETERRQFHERLNLALAELPEREYQAITLRLLDGFSPGEVAKAMNISKTTVRSHIGRGIKRLRKIMEDR